MVMKDIKNFIISLLLLGGIFCGGYYYGTSNVKTNTIVKSDTVVVNDTVTIRDTVKYFATKVKADTVWLHDTILVRYSSPFKIGSDTLNARGMVAFDTLFTFSDIVFTYPKHTTTITDSVFVTRKVEVINWVFTALISLLGFIFGIAI